MNAKPDMVYTHYWRKQCSGSRGIKLWWPSAKVYALTPFWMTYEITQHSEFSLLFHVNTEFS